MNPKESARQAQAMADAFQAELDANICPHCKQPIAKYQQVGRCVYGLPCNHRLYQGKVPHPNTTSTPEADMSAFIASGTFPAMHRHTYHATYDPRWERCTECGDIRTVS